MFVPRWCGACVAAIALLALPAKAQECWESLAELPAKTSATDKIAAVVSCSVEQGREVAALRSARDEATAARDAAQQAAAELQEKLDDLRALLGKAVLAFNRSEREGSCPDDWSLFKPAGGRVVVGAGEHANSGISTYPSFADNPGKAIGGAEQVTLSEAQMHEHEHKMFAPNSGAKPRTPTATDSVAVTGSRGLGMINENFEYQLRGHPGTAEFGISGKSGGNQPHNNMPPYIALYFCKKD